MSVLAPDRLCWTMMRWTFILLMVLFSPVVMMTVYSLGELDSVSTGPREVARTVAHARAAIGFLATQS